MDASGFFSFTTELASEPYDVFGLPHGYALDYRILLAGIVVDTVRVEIADANDHHSGGNASAAMEAFAAKLARIIAADNS